MMKLRDRLGIAGGRGLPCLFEGHGVAGGVALFAAEGAELAGRHADVGGVDVAIDVEVGHVAVHPLAHVVGQPAHGQHVVRAIEREAVVGAEPLLGQDLGGDGLQPRVVGAKGMRRRGRLFADFQRVGRQWGHALMIPEFA